MFRTVISDVSVTELVIPLPPKLGCEIRPEINVSDRNFGCYGK